MKGHICGTLSSATEPMGVRVLYKFRCGAMVNELKHYGLKCKFSAGRQVRHNDCNKVIQSRLETAGYPSTREPPWLSRTEGKRPHGQTIVPFHTEGQ